MIGRDANTTGGQGNVIIGVSANTTGTGNILIGNGVNIGGANNTIRIGGAGIQFATTQVAWTFPSDRRLKDNIKDSGLGLDFIKTLRPVSYVKKNDRKKRTEYGFIAQELEQALINADDANNGIIHVDEKGMYAVRYNDFIPLTVKAVQEQQTEIEALQKQNVELMEINASILKRLEALEAAEVAEVAEKK